MKLNFTVETRKINAVLKAITAVNEDCVVRSSGDGISFRLIDASNAAMIDVLMTPDVFVQFGENEGEIAVDVHEVLEKTNTFSPDILLTFTFDGYNKRLIIEGDGARYAISTMPLESIRKVPGVPNMEFPLEVVIEADRFRQMIKRAGLVSDHLIIGHSQEDKFYVSAEGDTNDFKQGTLGDLCEVVKKSDLETMYALDFLEPMAKIAAGSMNIRLGRDLPIVLDFTLEDVGIMYLLAPRIEKTNDGV